MNLHREGKILAATLIFCFGFCLIGTAQDGAKKDRRDDAQSNQLDERKRREGARGPRRRMNRQQQRPNFQALFNRFDQNKDGQLAADEIPERMQQRLGEFDLDESGTISMQEFKTVVQKRMQSMSGRGGMPGRGGKGKELQMDSATGATMMLERLDADGDEQISIDEVPDRMKEKFSTLDQDGNELLDKSEIVSMIERMKAKKADGKRGRYDTDREKTKAKMPKRPGSNG